MPLPLRVLTASLLPPGTLLLLLLLPTPLPLPPLTPVGGKTPTALPSGSLLPPPLLAMLPPPPPLPLLLLLLLSTTAFVRGSAAPLSASALTGELLLPLASATGAGTGTGARASAGAGTGCGSGTGTGLLPGIRISPARLMAIGTVGLYESSTRADPRRSTTLIPPMTRPKTW
jgi:hypothetical protein